MNAKEYLMQVGMIDAKLKAVDYMVAGIRKELRLIGNVDLSPSWPDGQPKGNKTTDPTGVKAVKLADQNSKAREKLKEQLIEYEHQQIELRSQLWTKRMEVTEKLSRLGESGNPMARVYHRLLTMKYLSYATWEEIAVEINYTWRHTIRLHGEALKEMERILKNG